MRISMVAIGSMGDVRPYILLGRELSRRGHQIRLLAFAPFEEAARQAGLDFLPLPGSLQHYMQNLMRPGGNALTFLPELEKAISGCKDALMDTILTGSRDAQAILTTFSMSAVYSVAEKLSIPCIQTYYFPLDPNEEYPLPVFPQLHLGRRYAAASYKVSYLVINAFERRLLTSWREKEGVEPPPLKPAPVMYIGAHRIPVLYAVSPHLLARPADWDEHIYMTGFWQDTEAEGFQPREELTQFLKNGDAPVYIGFGSMISGDMQRFFDKVAAAAKETGLRVILDGGWSADELPAMDSPYIYLNRGYINHDWLFPRVRAVVHHGGAGTTASGLRAGKPTLIIPFGGDQPFWGDQVYRQGLGPKPISRTLLTAGRLAEALRDLCCNARYAENAARMGELIRTENGVQAAADIAEREIAEWNKAE